MMGPITMFKKMKQIRIRINKQSKGGAIAT